MKKEKGITIIALILTIIIMLILVAVVVDVSIDGHLIDSAKHAVQGTNEKVAQTQNRVDGLMGELTEVEQSQCSHTFGTNGICTKCGARCSHTFNDDGICTRCGYECEHTYVNGVCTKCGMERTVNAGEKANETSKYKENNKTAVIPGGFTVSNIPGENTIDGGLVIYVIPDGAEIKWNDPDFMRSTYDQFVWIPVLRENINNMYMCQSEDGNKSCRITVQEIDGENVAYCTTHSSALMAGRLYATSSGESFNPNLTNQTYTENSGLREPDVVIDHDNSSYYLTRVNNIMGTSLTGIDDFKSYLQEEYNDIVKSVYENEGFYIGRYETSNMKNDDTLYTEPIKVIAGTIEGINVGRWYFMYSEQVDYANRNRLTSVGSTMIQGAAFDEVLKFVNTTNYDVKSKNNVAHTTGSGMTGVYPTGNTNYPSSATVSYNDFSKNIYDLAGNVGEFTSEASGTGYRVWIRWRLPSNGFT